MDKKDFQQGMNHGDAVKKNLGVGALKNDEARTSFWNSSNNLKYRPDYDGFVTVQEGIDWAKSHPGALENPTPENTLYLDASKLDFGSITTSDFPKGENVITPINLFNEANLVNSVGNETLRRTVYALGRVDMQLLDKSKGTVSIVNNSATDYDWNKGGGFIRDKFIKGERWRAGLNDSHGFKIYYYGTGTVKKPGTPVEVRYEHGKIM